MYFSFIFAVEFTNGHLSTSNCFREGKKCWCFSLLAWMSHVKYGLVGICRRQQCVIWVGSSVGSVEVKSALKIMFGRV